MLVLKALSGEDDDESSSSDEQQPLRPAALRYDRCHDSLASAVYGVKKTDIFIPSMLYCFC